MLVTTTAPDVDSGGSGLKISGSSSPIADGGGAATTLPGTTTTASNSLGGLSGASELATGSVAGVVGSTEAFLREPEALVVFGVAVELSSVLVVRRRLGVDEVASGVLSWEFSGVALGRLGLRGVDGGSIFDLHEGTYRQFA